LADRRLRERWLAATVAAARPCGVEAVLGALDDQLAFELGDRGQDVEEQPADRGGGVDALLQDPQPDLALLQLDGQGGEVLDRPAEAVESSDDQDVARAQVPHGRVELRAGGQLAGRLVDEQLVAAGSGEQVALGVGVLVAFADAAVADQGHGTRL
jgi:hypothetical protein